MVRRKINLDQIKDTVLLFLYSRVHDNLDGYMKSYDIAQSIGRTDVLVNVALEELEGGLYCKKHEAIDEDALLDHSGDGKVYYYTITKYGIDTVDDWKDEYYEKVEKVIFSIKKDGNRTENDSNRDNENLDLSSEWEPIAIERAGPAFESAVEASESALRTIEGSNGYAESEPEEREQIVWTIRSGLEALKVGTATRSIIQELLIKPFKFLAKKFVDAAIGVAAKLAAAKLTDLC